MAPKDTAASSGKNWKIRKRPTIKDIARETGVSTTTVLNVLGDKTSEVSKGVAEIVRRKATELGYVRNLTAASLTGKRAANAIALIITKAYNPLTPSQESDINPYYGEFILRLEHEARRAGYMLSLFGGNEEDYVNFVLQWNLDAAVLMGVHKPDLPRVIAQRGIPVLLVDCAFKDPHYVSVHTDDLKGGVLAAEHLIQRGCKSIAYVGNTHQPRAASPSIRLEGVRKTCRKHRIPLKEFAHNATFEDGVNAAQEIASSGVDGVFAAADNLAAGVIHGLTLAGKRVPDDVAVVGYDNLLIARMIRPTLTTIEPGISAKVKTIIDLISNSEPGKVHTIEPTLVVRESA